MAGVPAPVSGRELIAGLAAGYRRRRALTQAALAAGVGLLAIGAARAAGADAALTWPAGIAAAVIACAGALIRNRRSPVGPGEVARHLDRTFPSLEESTDLLLAEPAELGFVERLERTRVERALAAALPVQVPRDPSAGTTLIVGAVAAVAGVLLLLLPAGVRVAGASVGRGSSAHTVAIGGVTVRIAPPAYTGAPARTQRGWDIDAPEGAAISWRIRADADSAWITTSSGDTLPFAADAGERVTTLRASASLLYQVTAMRGGVWQSSELHRLAVQTDAPPTLLVAAPRSRVRLGAHDALRVPVEIHAGDDWGVGPARLVATLTSGEGEAVKFREQTIQLVRGAAASDLPHGVRFDATLDLAALGLKPGDELYFHAEAADHRTPSPNTARSETVFLTLADTGRQDIATIAGIAVSLAPEFFRSQRQIIMDTEKLIADRPRITLQIFRDRSNDIGLDQGLLRSRYGQYVGDETETGDNPEAGHQHDTPENSTLLADSVKSRLKAALAQMWEAELRLRTYRPADALPYEYRALEHLKEAQQSARVYVQRVGFEPPPLDPARTRLSGKLEGIGSRTDRDSAGIALAYPATRHAIAALSGATALEPLPAATLAALEHAVAELAPRAAADSAVFSTIRSIQALADSARTGARCAGCTERALGGLLRAVPAADPLPASDREPAGALARRYFELLETAR